MFFGWFLSGVRFWGGWPVFVQVRLGFITLYFCGGGEVLMMVDFQW